MHPSNDPRAHALCWDGGMDARYPPLAHRAKAAYERHPDLFAALATGVVGVALLALGIAGTWGTLAVVPRDAIEPWWFLATLLPGCAVMLVKRRHPMAALAAGAALFAVDVALGGSLGMLLVFIDLIYAAAYWASPRARSVLLGLIAGGVAASALVPAVLGRSVQECVLLALQSFAILATPYWWAAAVRRGRELAASEAARADDAARLAAVDREHAVREERSRMARELHDVIASNLSAIAIHSEAALSRAPDAARERRALAAVRTASVEGLEQMRSMIMVLRTGAEARVVPPRLASLDRLVEDSGLDVEIVGELPALPTAGEQAATRIIAESLRNAAKHTPGARVRIDLDATADAGVLAVRSVGGVPARAVGTGHGIVMMRERAERVGGTLTAGEAGDAWVVSARIPRSTP